jgi:hypothetical protein
VGSWLIAAVAEQHLTRSTAWVRLDLGWPSKDVNLPTAEATGPSPPGSTISGTLGAAKDRRQ